MGSPAHGPRRTAPAPHRPGRRRNTTKTEFLPRRELDHVLALLTYENEQVLRVALETGLRVGDVLALRPPPRAQCWITEAKTKKRRRVNLRRERIEALQRISGEHWIFPGRTDKTRHRTRQAVWKDIKRAQRALRLPVNIGPHTARKVYAVNRLRETGSVSKVRLSLNHSSEATTAIYTLAQALYDSRYQEKDGRIIRKTRRKISRRE